MANPFEEVYRLRFQSDGQANAESLSAAIKELGTAAEDVQQRSAGFLDDLVAANGAQRSIGVFREIADSVRSMAKQLPAAREEVARLGRELAETEKPTKAQERAFEASRKSLKALQLQYDTQKSKLRELRSELGAQGLATSNLVAAEKTLQDRRTAAIAAIESEAAALKTQRAAAEQAAQAAAALASAEAEQAAAAAAAAKTAEAAAAARAEADARVAAAAGEVAAAADARRRAEERALAAARQTRAEAERIAAAAREQAAADAAAARETDARAASSRAAQQEAASLAAAIREIADASNEAGAASAAYLREYQQSGAVKTAITTFRDTADQVQRLSRALPEARTEFDRLARAVKSIESPTREQSAAFEAAKRSLAALEAEYQAARTRMAALRTELKAQGVNLRELGAAEAELERRRRDSVNAINQQLDATRRARDEARRLAEARRQQADAEREAQRETARSVGGLKTLAAAIAASFAGRAVVDTFRGAIDSAREFERELDGVKAVTGASAAEMVQFRAAAERAASTTKFTALEAAQALGELARATGSASTAIAALPATTSLAQAAGLELAESAQFITTALTQFGLAADQAGRVADVLARAANSTTADVRGLGLALSYSAPLARQLGLNLEQTTAVIGALADQGFRGERAGTALRNVFSQLATPASEFRIALLGAGVESDNFIDIIDELAKSGEVGKQALLSLDAEARPAILALVNQGGAGIKQLRDQLNAAKGDAEATASVMTNNFDGAVLRFVSALDAARRALVDPLLEPLKKEFDSAAIRVQEFIKSADFATLRESVKTFVLSATEAFKKFIDEVDFTRLSTSIATFADDAKRRFGEVSDSAGELLSGLRIIINSLSIIFNGLQVTVGIVAASIISSFTRIVGAILDTVKAVNDVLPAIARQDEAVARLKAKYDALKQTADDLWDGVRKDSDEVADGFKGIAEALLWIRDRGKDAKVVVGSIGESGKKAADDVKVLGDQLNLVPDYSRGAGDGVSAFLGPMRDLNRESLLAAQSMQQFDAAGRPLDPMLELLRTKLSDASRRFGDLVRSGERSPEVLAAANAEFNQAAIELGEYARASINAEAAQKRLSDAAGGLGMKSLAELEQAARGARAGLDEYVEAARRGEVSQEAVNQAFREYAQRQLELAEAAGASARSRILNELNVKAALTGNTEQLKQMIAAYSSLSGAKPPAMPTGPVNNYRQALDNAGESGKQLGEKTQKALKDATWSLTGVAGGINGIRANFAATSEVAAQFFDRLVFDGGRALSALNFGDAFDGAAGRVTRAVEATQKAIDLQRTGVVGLTASLNALGIDGPEAFRRMGHEVSSTLAGLDSLELSIKSGAQGFNLLGQQDLGPLQAALESARQRIRAIADQANSAREELLNMAAASRDAVDQANGNLEAIEQRRHQQQLDRIKDLAQQGGTEAQAAADQARAAAEAQHAQALRDIQERKREQMRADNEAAANRLRNEQEFTASSSSGGGSSVTRTPSHSPTPAATYRLEFGNGRFVDVNGSQSNAAALVAELKRWAQLSGRSGR